MVKNENKAEKDAEIVEVSDEVKEYMKRVETIAGNVGITIEKGDHLSVAVRKIARVKDESARLALGDYLLALQERGLKPKSVRTAVWDAASILSDEPMAGPISKLTKRRVEEYFSLMEAGKLRKTPKGANLFRRQLRKFLAYCVDAGISAKALKPALNSLQPPKKAKKAE